MTGARLGDIPAAPESALPPAVARRLPAAAPAAPWECTLRGVCWLQPAGPGAAAAVPPALGEALRPGWAVGAILRYLRSPVGPYAEVVGALVERRGLALRAHVPLMAVDSLASIRGGRANWALPKTLAAVSGAPGRLGATGPGWWLEADVHPLGPVVPVAGWFSCWQVGPEGAVRTFRAGLRGRGRPVRVRVRHSPQSSLNGWLPAGSRIGVQLLDARLRVGVPGPPAGPAPTERRGASGAAEGIPVQPSGRARWWSM